MLGVQPDADGFTVLHFARDLGDLAWAEDIVPTPYGNVRVAPKRAGTRPEATLSSIEHPVFKRGPSTMVASLRELFLLDPNIIYLNHGSYGACPRPVFERYQAWQRELELNPMGFYGERQPALMTVAREALGAYLGVTGGDVVYFANPTTATRIICRSLQLEPGDEILATDWEYPAMESTWDFVAHLRGSRFVRQPVPVPMDDPMAWADAYWSGVTPRTRILYLSHISFTSSLIFPVAEICRRAREAGIMTFIDGAHAPSQIPLDLAAIDADIYVGACHKWLCAPKGAG